MTQNGDKNISSELSNRLDSLFSDSAERATDGSHLKPSTAEPERTDQSDDSSRADVNALPGRVADNAAVSDKSPLLDLQAIILSLDWEITDDTMNRLLDEIERLKGVYRKERLPLMFLQLHASVGKYISTRKASAHPDSIKLLHSIYGGLHQLLTSVGMNEAQKKKILSTEVDKFKKLKEQILIAKSDTASARRKPSSRPLETALVPSDNVGDGLAEKIQQKALSAGDDAPPIDGDRLQTAVEELKQVIRDEIASLRKEIISMIKG
ncbi:MAG: hypothetical protein JEZ11_05585 [Desulfobacterales bacterium]|nr:hypothetical protein [Desulfobacterales bacterium]